MAWWRKRGPMDVAELLVPRGQFRGVDRESTTLDDRDTVLGWLRTVRPGVDRQVFVHRSWGTVAAVAEERYPDDVGLYLSDGDTSWAAVAPGSPEDLRQCHLTPDQVEHVVLDALTSPERPAWPDWRYLV
jgi:hypothetical protein